MTDLANSSFLIVGGTGGVGLETALQIADAGGKKIAVAGRNAERGEGAAKSIRARGASEAIYIQADGGDPAAAQLAVERVEKVFGGIDVLVCSTAAEVFPRLLKDIPIEDIQRTLVEQAVSPLIMSRAVLPGMRERKSGTIINIASDAAKSATPGETVIGAAMAAIVMFSRALAMEAKRDGIRVNVLTPSIINGTPLYDRLMKDDFSVKLFGKAEKMAELGVVGPEDIARMIVFLAGPGGAKITGQAISVNGGISAA